ncbi:ferrous iron transport protein B [Paenibacillus caui]|uniref:ferrous iron transport protein B n=1 Tax=Paenibacillus caui TaxID=2873927 RepID=UPI001CA8261E|nr:ferrous iron transport protein B [Paenibacillus caui]
MKNAALIGNPNTGKTSLFNKLTSSYEYVGNWSGVTVEKKVGELRDNSGLLTDLPGIYSLRPLSKDEAVAAHYLMEESPSLLINIVDASQLERNLQLTLQLVDYGKPVVIGLNMTDVAKARGIEVYSDVLADELGVPVIPLIARTGAGSRELLEKVRELEPPSDGMAAGHLFYGAAIEEAVDRISRELGAASFPKDTRASLRWIALQILENNPAVMDALPHGLNDSLSLICASCSSRLEAEGVSQSIPEYMKHIRTERINRICRKAMDRSHQKPHSLTERIDSVVTHPLFGLPLFAAFMFLMFQITFDWVGNPLSDLLDSFISGPLNNWISDGLSAIHASAFTSALILDGIAGGVGGVLVFVPQIFLLFLMISFIEDSGYMARITLLTDKWMEKIGLSGKSIIPFIIGFGCNVPAIMAARSIEQPKERTLTMLLVPLMSCSARLPVYALFAGIFFESHQALIVLSLYLLGIVSAMLAAKLFSSVLFNGSSSLFVIELPPYRMPQMAALFRNTWEKGKGFLRKAGTIIMGGSVVIWLLTFCGPSGINVDMNDSFLAWIGGLVAPLLSPIGFGTWQAGASLITGFMAKEVVVSTMNIIYHAPGDLLGQQIAHAFTPLQGLSFMVFVLLYTPCLATVGVIRKESASWKWTLFSVGYCLILAYLVSFIFYQGARLLGFS